MLDTYIDNKDYIDQRIKDIQLNLNIQNAKNNAITSENIKNIFKKIEELTILINKIKVDYDEKIEYISLPWYKKLFKKNKFNIKK